MMRRPTRKNCARQKGRMQNRFLVVEDALAQTETGQARREIPFGASSCVAGASCPVALTRRAGETALASTKKH